MRSCKITRYGITLLLLLTFFQQIGGGLFIHNLEHDQTESGQLPYGNDGKMEINFSCSCVDDFVMPFLATDDPPALQIPILYSAYADAYTVRQHIASTCQISLRGPPAQIG